MRKNKDLPFNGYPIQSGMIGESGRTLIEMLGVLAIMGLLTVVGIKTYNSAGEKSKAMAVAKQIQMMATDHRVRYNKRTSINQEFTVKGPHDISLTLKDGSAGNSENYFWISVSTDKSAFCKELVDSSAVRSDFTTVNGELEGNCPGEVRFYFRKNMADKLISMTYTDKDGKQHFCPDHAICGAKSWDCVEDGYIKNESETKCIRCVWPASGCDDDGNPTDCAEGYDLYENECVSIESECTAEGDTCGHGTCDAYGACICEVGYSGDNCNKVASGQICSLDTPCPSGEYCHYTKYTYAFEVEDALAGKTGVCKGINGITRYVEGLGTIRAGNETMHYYDAYNWCDAQGMSLIPTGKNGMYCYVYNKTTLQSEETATGYCCDSGKKCTQSSWENRSTNGLFSPFIVRLESVLGSGKTYTSATGRSTAPGGLHTFVITSGMIGTGMKGSVYYPLCFNSPNND